jgi:hypothetical protein
VEGEIPEICVDGSESLGDHTGQVKGQRRYIIHDGRPEADDIALGAVNPPGQPAKLSTKPLGLVLVAAVDVTSRTEDERFPCEVAAHKLGELLVDLKQGRLRLAVDEEVANELDPDCRTPWPPLGCPGEQLPGEHIWMSMLESVPDLEEESGSSAEDTIGIRFTGDEIELCHLVGGRLYLFIIP